MPKFAANLTTLFTEVPFLERFARAAKAGFAAVEFQYPYEHKPADLAARLKDNGLTCVLFNMPPGNPGERGMACLPGREQDFKDSVARALGYALAVGAPNLHTLAGQFDGMMQTEHLDTYIANLRMAAGKLAAHGMTLLIEPLNARDVPGYFLFDMDWAASTCEQVGAPNLKIQMDFYHAQMTTGRLTETFREHSEKIGHLQIAGVPGRHEPDDGEINYAHLFKLIDASGYGGWIGCEYIPRGRTEDGLGWLKTLV